MRMNKFGMLFAATGVALAAILTAGRLVTGSMVRVTAVKMTPSTAENTVVCSGKIESMDARSVYPSCNATTRQVYVREGDRVSAGQVLMKVTPLAGLAGSQPSYEDAYGAYSAYLNQSASSLPFPSGSGAGNGETAVVAPISGTVESLAAAGEGEYLSADKPAVVIRNSQDVQVRVQVGESQAAELKTGQKARVSGVGFQSVYDGTVDSIAAEAKQQITATGQETIVETVVKIKDPGPDIKPGFSAKVSITVSDSKNVLIVPYEAVRADDDGNEYVFLAVRGKAVKTPVTTGREFDSGFEIKSGVSADDAVILEPDAVSDGTRILTAYRKAGDL